MVCQAMSIAMTVVLPAPVASFSASRISSGLASALALARCSRNLFPASTLRRDLGQPDRRLDSLDLAEEGPDALKLWCRQCWRSRAVSGSPASRWDWAGSATRSTWLAKLVDDRGRVVLLLLPSKAPCPRRNTKSSPGSADSLRFRGFGIGVMNRAGRRVSMICCVGWPSPSSSQCRAGYS